MGGQDLVAVADRDAPGSLEVPTIGNDLVVDHPPQVAAGVRADLAVDVELPLFLEVLDQPEGDRTEVPVDGDVVGGLLPVLASYAGRFEAEFGEDRYPGLPEGLPKDTPRDVA